MFELRTLGGFRLLSGADTSARPISMPRRHAALLAYLAVARSSTGVSRDELLELFWAGRPRARGLASLRQSVHALRRLLGEEVLERHTGEAIELKAESISCDAAELRRAIADEHWMEAIELYRGEFLEGFTLPNAWTFEMWRERQRVALREMAAFAAWSLAGEEEHAGSASRAAYWGRKAVGLARHDDAAVRRLIQLLHRMGDDLGAVNVYESFVRQAAADIAIAPSDETKSLVADIRARQKRSTRDEPPEAR